VDHFHAVKLANTVVDQVRRRTQQALLGHRGRKDDSLYRIRKLLVTAAEQLTSRGRARLRGPDPGDRFGEVTAAWQGKELLRAVYAAGDLAGARAALDRFYRRCDGVQLLELSRLARTVRVWQTEILARHRAAGCSNGPTEAINLLIKKRSGSGMASATSPTTGCGCCCSAASGGRPTEPQGCEAAHHAWWRRARLVTKRRTRSHWACPPLRLFRPPVSVRPEGGAELVDHVCVAEGVVEEVLRPSPEVKAPVWRRDRPPGVQQNRSHPWNRDVRLARNGLGR
jgi:hypothetical protein